ncbi:TetR/AcrR family transcriptional regulator [Saccharothrix syringae]|uniref:TetR/AcrR family transcriptional regulator n=1 Tax=Saccharothrix syringae TaxID=103733 RepID=A0A5Q0H111_SACSY|nr:TetR/AcrR family transcriptional regulator [Saccharothrix syringae]QFZ19362.1 TetR/AcrR family transcriptional regulator [Saccharothrix syringae]
MSGEPTRLRVDALANRNRVLAAAREAFAAEGLDVPMTTIARRAGVGAATLYRRFPTKEALVTEVFADQFASCTAVVHEGLEDPDPWRGFCVVVTEMCAMHAADRGFGAAFLAAHPDALAVTEERARAEAAFAELVRRAQATGRLRADFTVDDFVLLLMANSGVSTGSAEVTRAASRRLVAYFLQACQADGPLPPAVPLGLDEVLGGAR